MKAWPSRSFGSSAIRIVRAGSPVGTDSTLTTSAPKSPMIVVAYGPARCRVKSSTRIPASGPVGPPAAGAALSVTATSAPQRLAHGLGDDPALDLGGATANQGLHPLAEVALHVRLGKHAMAT